MGGEMECLVSTYPDRPERLTDGKVRAFPCPSKDPATGKVRKVRIRDSEVPELALRLGSRDKTWILYTKHAGRLIEEGLGSFPTVSTEEARKRARKAMAAYERDEDPQLDRIIAEVSAEAVASLPKPATPAILEAMRSAALSAAAVMLSPWRAKIRPSETLPESRARALGSAVEAARVALREAEAQRERQRINTVAALFQSWFSKVAEPHHKTAKLEAYQWRRYLAPRIGERLVSEVTHATVEALHLEIGEQHGRTMANRCKALLSALFEHARKVDRTLENPCAQVQSYAEKSRDRFMDAGEIRRFFDALDAEEDGTACDWFRLALLTGARKSNLCSMAWRDLDLDRLIWTVPGELSKNGDPLTIPIVPGAFEVLRRRRAAIPAAVPWVFPGRGKTGHYVEPARAWDRIKRRAELAGILDLIAATGAPVPTLAEVLAGVVETQVRAIVTRTKLAEDGDTLDGALAHWRAAAVAHGVNPDDAVMLDLRIHDLRRSLGSWLTIGGTSLAVVGRALGHRDRRSTDPYARLNLDPVRLAMGEATGRMLATVRNIKAEEVTP
jgi:integrase